MAVSGTISTTVFNTQKVIDQAFRRCRLPAQAITAEMQGYARDTLYLLLSEIASVKPPSWCIEKQIYPLYEGQSVITLDTGTVEVMNVNLRVMQDAASDISPVTTSTSITYDFTGTDSGAGTVNTVGVKWSATSVNLTFEVSNDGSTWVTVGTQTATADAGEWTWTDIEPGYSRGYFRITATSTISYADVYLGNTPQEIPMGVLNRDTYVAQTNKVFQGRPLTYWYQRQQVNPQLHVWPAPNAAAELYQVIVWRHRHIMDVGTFSQEIEVPQRWLEAIIAMLAPRVGIQTPTVDLNLIPMLDQKAEFAYQKARDGDNSGAPIVIQPAIACYTR